MSAKKLTQMLPPKRSAKREVGVNVRFTQDEHEALVRIAEYRDITVTELIYHVVSQVGLPTLLEEMDAEIAATQGATPAVTSSELLMEIPASTFSTHTVQVGLPLAIADSRSGPEQPRHSDGSLARSVSRSLPDGSD